MGGNAAWNEFLDRFGADVSMDDDIKLKYASNAATLYREKMNAISEGKAWSEPVATIKTAKKAQGLDCRRDTTAMRKAGTANAFSHSVKVGGSKDSWDDWGENW
eukprot:TRINITY_DN914_c0_g1_i11.p2 TRINITY_DN914_c0_g1~~TRINITY_DN914_c0_g1_i11.p2  ORF type:complete len:104 (+),score=21.70 TRINITY_DN914_c0_g1_i11:414-725(+)